MVECPVRVREKLIEYEGMTDRNAKHMYLEKCQSTPGYNCTFYTIKVCHYQLHTHTKVYHHLLYIR